MPLTIYFQLIYLFVMAIPIACIAWTVTHEEVFKEPREFCEKKSKECKSLIQRKFSYGGAGDFREMRAAAQLLAHLVSQRADICS